jgi:F0F1-type ATP synthase epsilon subunit
LVPLYLEVLTPQATIIDVEVASVMLPLPDGWLEVLPGHTEFQARLLPGEVMFKVDDRQRVLTQLGGTVMVGDNRVTILTGVAGLDSDLETLERSISEETEQLAEMEQEAERHFDRVYRQMAQTLNHRRGGRV